MLEILMLHAVIFEMEPLETNMVYDERMYWLIAVFFMILSLWAVKTIFKN